MKPSFRLLCLIAAASLAVPAPPARAERACAAPPPQAVAAGFNRLDFELDPTKPIDIGWNDEAGHDWYPGLWWEHSRPHRDQITQDRARGILRISDATLTTIVHRDPSPGGRAWNGGYFEIDGVGHNWAGFWFMSLLHAQRKPQLANDPLTYTSEFDIYEGDEGTPSTLVSTLHLDTSADAGVHDRINRNNNKNVSPVNIAGTRHKIGGLWLPDRIDIYLDDQKVNSFPTFASTNQPMFMVIGEGPRGVNGGPTIEPRGYIIHSLCVWQKQ